MKISYNSIKKWYINAAIIAFNCLILFCLFGTIYFTINGPENRLINNLHPLFTESGILKNGKSSFVSHFFIPKNYTELKQSDVQKIINEMETWVSTGSWQIDPWTGMLTNRSFSGEQMNVDANGRRKTVSPNPKYGGLPKLRIAMYGGSTTFGWGMPDSLTLSSLLQQKMQGYFKDRQVVVTNYGVPYYNSGQESILFLATLTQLADTPDIAIFLDGMNDSSNLPESKRPNMTIKFIGAVWEDYIEKLSNQASDNGNRSNRQQIGDLPPSKSRASGDDLWDRLNSTRNPKEVIDLSVDYTLKNWKSIKLLSSGYGITPYIFIQPARTASISTMPTNNQAYYRELVKSVDNKIIFDLSEIFIDAGSGKIKKRNSQESVSFPFVIDHGHYSEPATRYIANEIGGIIIDTFPKNRPAKN